MYSYSHEIMFYSHMYPQHLTQLQLHSGHTNQQIEYDSVWKYIWHNGDFCKFLKHKSFFCFVKPNNLVSTIEKLC